VADKFGRFLHDRRQIFVGRFYWQTKLANFILRLTSALAFAGAPASFCSICGVAAEYDLDTILYSENDRNLENIKVKPQCASFV